MDYAVFTKLMIRVAGFLTIMFAVGSIPASVLWLTVATGGGPGVLLILGSLSLPLVLGTVLFLSAGRITNRSFPTHSASGARPIEAKGFESAALFVLAWYVLAYAIPDAVPASLFVVMHALGARAVPIVMTTEYARLGGVAAKFIIAIGLIVYSRRLIAEKDAYQVRDTA